MAPAKRHARSRPGGEHDDQHHHPDSRHQRAGVVGVVNGEGVARALDGFLILALLLHDPHRERSDGRNRAEADKGIGRAVNVAIGRITLGGTGSAATFTGGLPPAGEA